MAGVSSSQEEVEGLDRLLTRLALTEDTKLEKVLEKLLPLAVRRLSSPHEASRKKVIEMLTHINIRIRDQLGIKLPLKEFIQLYKESVSIPTPMVLNFAMVYLDMAFERESKENRLAAVSDLLEGVSSRPAEHKFMLMRCAALGLEPFGSERGARTDEVKDKYPFMKDKSDSSTWLEFCQMTLLYWPTCAPSDGNGANAGLSLQQIQWVSGNGKQKSAMIGDRLATRKLGLINFNVAVGFSNAQLYPHFLIAASDSNDRVSRRGEDLLKRRAGSLSLDDAQLMKKLFSLYQGSIPGPNPLPEQLKVAPAGIALKLRLVPTFCRSVVAANCFPATIQVIFDAVYGEGTNMRLKQAGMEFAVWVFKQASEEQLKPMAPVILTGLLKLLNESDPNDPDRGVQQLRAFTFQAIGQLAGRAPYLFRGSSGMAVRLFGALKQESQSTRSIVQDAVVALASAYEGCTDKTKTEIEALLLENISAVEDSARFCAVQWVIKLVSSSHAIGRYICMLGCGDKKLEIREMSERALFPFPSSSSTSSSPSSTSSQPSPNPKTDSQPTLEAMLRCVVQQKPSLVSPAKLGEQTLIFPNATFVALLRFLSLCWEKEEKKKKEEGRKEGDGMGSLGTYGKVLEHAMARDGSWELHSMAASGLLEMASMHPEEVSKEYSGKFEWLKQFLGHADPATRESFARLAGVVSSALDADVAAALVEELLTSAESSGSAKGARFEDQIGAISTVGYVLAQSRSGKPLISPPLLSSATARLASLLLAPSASEPIAASAAAALGHVGLAGPLALPPGGSSLDVVVAGMRKLLERSDAKVVQAAARALGHLCFGDEEASGKALEALFGLKSHKSEEVLFAVGESLSLVWGSLGPTVTVNTFLRSTHSSLADSRTFLEASITGAPEALEKGPDERLDVDMKDPAEELPECSAARSVARAAMRRTLLEELMPSGRKEERCAGSVWMMSLLTYARDQSRELNKMLPEIQEAFSHLLGDSHELTQEMASRGMSLVYEFADEGLKQELVEALVGTLSGATKKKRAVKLMEESEVFTDNALGQAPGGGNLTTYKELCTLATDMGQPDMIYKFMELANYQASLNSRRGAAFGFADIARRAGSSLTPHLPQLLPKLLRHLYDPSKAVQDAMAHIWRALVAEPKKTIDQYWDGIVQDLLKEAGSRLWRSRESACLALADLLTSRKFEEVSPYLSSLWTVAFRASDDIKESVRLAGDKLCRSTASLSLRLTDPTLTPPSQAKEACETLLPLLLGHGGMLSSVGSVRATSLTTIAKIVKSAGSSIRGTLPDIVAAMLEGLSGLEDQKLNYVEQHAERAGISSDRLESARLSLAKDSPMWETLDWCLKQVDGDSLPGTVSKLVELARSGVGLNTRVGTARFISQLVQRLGPVAMKPYAPQLLKVLVPAVQSEKSASSRKWFAAACAEVARCAGDARVARLVSDAVALYWSNFGERDARVCSGVLLRELAKTVPEPLKLSAGALIPLAFIGRYDEEPGVKQIFEELWEEVSGTGSGTVQLYLPEITTLLCEGMLTSSWTRKQQSAKAAMELAELVGDGMNAEMVQKIMDSLLVELPGRLWEGKESVLEAIGKIFQACASVIALGSSSLTPETVVRSLLAQCERKKTAYRVHALKALRTVLAASKGTDTLALVADPVLQILSPDTKPDTKGTSAMHSESEPTSATLVAPALECLAASFPTASLDTLTKKGEAIVKALVGCLSSTSPWTTKIVAAKTAKSYVESVESAANSDNTTIPNHGFGALALALGELLDDLKYSEVRSAALESLKAIKSTRIGKLTIQDNADLKTTLEQKLHFLANNDKNAAIKAQALSTSQV